MSYKPPKALVRLIHRELANLLALYPAATSSEAYVREHTEMRILDHTSGPRYLLRIGINYHGAKVQHLQADGKGVLVGWNPTGDALGIGKKAKVLLAGYTIFPRDVGEPVMSDTKVGGGGMPAGKYVRIEFKARGWLGKTKNLDGKQLEKDFDLLKDDKADLLVICLSETAHRKWCGEGPAHQANRRTGTGRFIQILGDYSRISLNKVKERKVTFEGQRWAISSQRVAGSPSSLMPGAEHSLTLVWKI